VTALESVFRHRPVDLVQQVGPDLDHQVGPDAEHVAVVGGVVDLAERQPVPHGGDSCFFTVRNDVGRVKELVMSQCTHRIAVS
jgi:hypothetical protein